MTPFDISLVSFSVFVSYYLLLEWKVPKMAHRDLLIRAQVDMAHSIFTALWMVLYWLNILKVPLLQVSIGYHLLSLLCLYGNLGRYLDSLLSVYFYQTLSFMTYIALGSTVPYLSLIEIPGGVRGIIIIKWRTLTPTTAKIVDTIVLILCRVIYPLYLSIYIGSFLWIWITLPTIWTMVH